MLRPYNQPEKIIGLNLAGKHAGKERNTHTAQCKAYNYIHAFCWLPRQGCFTCLNLSSWGSFAKDPAFPSLAGISDEGYENRW